MEVLHCSMDSWSWSTIIDVSRDLSFTDIIGNINYLHNTVSGCGNWVQCTVLSILYVPSNVPNFCSVRHFSLSFNGSLLKKVQVKTSVYCLVNVLWKEKTERTSQNFAISLHESVVVFTKDLSNSLSDVVGVTASGWSLTVWSDLSKHSCKVITADQWPCC